MYEISCEKKINDATQGPAILKGCEKPRQNAKTALHHVTVWTTTAAEPESLSSGIVPVTRDRIREAHSNTFCSI